MKKLFVLCLLSFAFCFAVEVLAYTQTDASNANFLADQGIIVKQSTTAGYRLDNTITRAELVGIALKLKGVTLPSYQCKGYFSDVQNNDWICRAVELAADYGLVTRANSKFRPQDNITKVETLAIILSAGGIVVDKSVTGDFYGVIYTNTDPEDWQADVMEAARRQYIISPNSTSYYSPVGTVTEYFWDFNRAATRAEVFEFARKIIEKRSTKEDMYAQYFSADFGDNYTKLESEEGIESFGFGGKVDITGSDSYRYRIDVFSAEKAYLGVGDEFAGTGIYKGMTYYTFSYVGMCSGKFIVFFVGDKLVTIDSFCQEDIGDLINRLEVVDFEIPTGHRLVNKLDIFSIYYQFINAEYFTNAYSMRSPTGVSSETFQSWYKNVTRVVFHEDTLKNLGDNTYEFLVDITDNGVKSTYKVKSKVDLENFTINNISSVKQ